MRLNRLFPILIGVCLILFPTVYVWGNDIDPNEALRLLEKKKENEERQLNKLSEMVLVPGGKFLMGRKGVNNNEMPLHQVSIDSFYIDKYEITQLQYLSVMERNPSYFKGCPLCPVEKVSFYHAKEYCKKLGKRLPTEAEWEKAAKGGMPGEYYWEHEKAELFAWYGNNSGSKTQPVGERQPNLFGIYDMAGNVWEWVSDWYDAEFYKISPGMNPKGPSTGKEKVVRGGSWGDPPERLAHAYRNFKEPDTMYINVGFRCASNNSIKLNAHE